MAGRPLLELVVLELCECIHRARVAPLCKRLARELLLRRLEPLLELGAGLLILVALGRHINRLLGTGASSFRRRRRLEGGVALTRRRTRIRRRRRGVVVGVGEAAEAAAGGAVEEPAGLEEGSRGARSSAMA